MASTGAPQGVVGLSAAELAHRLAAGEVTSVEAVQAHLDRIRETDGEPVDPADRSRGRTGLMISTFAVSTPSVRSWRMSWAPSSSPTEATSRTSPPSRAAATAWLAPLPPGMK